MKISDFKASNPEYSTIPDDQLAVALHKKYYANVPLTDFLLSVGIKGPDPTGNFGENLLAGVGSGMASLYRGGKQLFNIGDQQKLQQDVDEAKRLEKPLDSSVGGFLGGVVGRAAPFAPAILASGPSVIGAGLIGAGQGALEQTGTGESRGLNTAIGGGLGMAGQAIGNKISDIARSRAQNIANQQAQNLVRDTTLKEAQDLGYKVPPSTINPSLLNTTLEKIGGKVATQQQASLANQGVTNAIARTESGLVQNAPITRGALESVRSAAGNAYDPVKSIGNIVSDYKYLNDLNNISARHAGSASFPDLVKQNVSDLISGLNVRKFDANDGIELVKTLRLDGFSNSAARDAETKALGKAQIEASKALEDLMERKLATHGQPAALEALKEARKQIAKTYAVQNATNLGSGDVSAMALGLALDSGVPLSGGLEKTGKFALAFPKAVQDAASIGSPVSHTEAAASLMAGLGGMAASGSPTGLLASGIPLARGPIRNLILSNAYQKMMAVPGYKAGLLTQLAPYASPLLRGGAAPSGLLTMEANQ